MKKWFTWMNISLSFPLSTMTRTLHIFICQNIPCLTLIYVSCRLDLILSLIKLTSSNTNYLKVWERWRNWIKKMAFYKNRLNFESNMIDSKIWERSKRIWIFEIFVIEIWFERKVIPKNISKVWENQSIWNKM